MGNTPSQGGYHHPPGQGQNPSAMVIGRPQDPNENLNTRPSPERNLRPIDESVEVPKFRNPLAMMIGNGTTCESSRSTFNKQGPLPSPPTSETSRRPIPKPPRKMDASAVPLIRPQPPPVHFEEPEEFSLDSLAADTVSSVRTDDISPSSLSPAEDSRGPPNPFSTCNPQGPHSAAAYSTCRRKSRDEVSDFPRSSNLGVLFRRGSSYSSDTLEGSVNPYDSLNEKSESDRSSHIGTNSISANSSSPSSCGSIVQLAPPVNIVTVNGLKIAGKESSDSERSFEGLQSRKQDLSLESQTSCTKSYSSSLFDDNNDTLKGTSEANSDSINPDSLSPSHSSGFVSEADGLDVKVQSAQNISTSSSFSKKDSSFVSQKDANLAIKNKTPINTKSEPESPINERCEVQQVQPFDCSSARDVQSVKNQTMKDTEKMVNKSVECEPYNSQIERNGNNVCIIQINGETTPNCKKPQSNCIINKEITLEECEMPAKQEEPKEQQDCYHIKSSHQQNHRPLSDHPNILFPLRDECNSKKENYRDPKDKLVISSLTFLDGENQRKDGEVFTEVSLQSSSDGLSSVELPKEGRKLSTRNAQAKGSMALPIKCDSFHRNTDVVGSSSTSESSSLVGRNNDSTDNISDDSTTVNEHDNNNVASTPVVLRENKGRRKLKDIMISPSLDEFESLEAEVSKFDSNASESSMSPFKETLFGSNYKKNASPKSLTANQVALIDEMFVTQKQRRSGFVPDTSSPYYTIEKQRLLLHSSQDREIQEECINFHKEATTDADMIRDDANSSILSYDNNDGMSSISSLQVNESATDEVSSYKTSHSGEYKSSNDDSINKRKTFFSDFSNKFDATRDKDSLNSSLGTTAVDSILGKKFDSDLNSSGDFQTDKSSSEEQNDESMTFTESSSVDTCLVIKESGEEEGESLEVTDDSKSEEVETNKSAADKSRISHISTVYMCDESPAVIEMGDPFTPPVKQQQSLKDFDLESNKANCNSSPSGTLNSVFSDELSSPPDSLEPKQDKEDTQVPFPEPDSINTTAADSSNSASNSEAKIEPRKKSSSPPKTAEKKASKSSGNVAYKKPWLARRSRGSITDAFPEVEICDSSKKSSPLEITDLELFQPKEEVISQTPDDLTPEETKQPVGDIKELLESKECEQESRPVKKFEEKKQFLSIAHWGEIKELTPVETLDAHEVFSEEDLEIEQFEIPDKTAPVAPTDNREDKNEISDSESARPALHSLHSMTEDIPMLLPSKRSFAPLIAKLNETANSTPSSSSNECSLVILPKNRKSTTDGILQELKRKENSHRHHHHHHHRSSACSSSGHHHGKSRFHGVTLDENFELLLPTHNILCSRVTETISEGNEQLKIADNSHGLTSSQGPCEPAILSGRHQAPGFGDTYRKSKSDLTLEGNSVDEEQPKGKFLGTADNSGNIMSPSLSNNFMDMNGTDNHKDNEDSSASATPEENFSRQLQEKENYINELQSNLEELKLKANTESSYTRVLSEYEKTLSMYVQKVDELKGKLDVAELEKRELIQERDQALEDLRNVESAFSDVHRKYERSKALLESMKTNEESLIQRDQEMVQKLHIQDKRIETLKEKAQESLDQMYQDYESKIKDLEGENVRLRAQFRKMEMKLDSLENDVEQKAKENAKLSALCDELIHGPGNN